MTEEAGVTVRHEFSLIVGYGTDMGNAEDAAMTFTEALGDIGIDVEAIELNQIDVTDLRSATHFIAVTSTFGDGEFPDNATLFWRRSAAWPNHTRAQFIGTVRNRRGQISDLLRDLVPAA